MPMKMKHLLVALALLLAPPAFSQTLTFTVETTSSGGAAVVPKLTWATTPAATSCTATAVPVSADWTGTKAAAGTATLPSINATNSYTLVCNWPGDLFATLNWTKPTTNTDGSAYTNPGGFRVQYGRTSANLDQSVYLQDPAAVTWRSPQLASGAWFFGVKAYNTLGLESDSSNITTKTLTASSSQTRSLEIVVKFPAAPTGVTVQ